MNTNLIPEHVVDRRSFDLWWSANANALSASPTRASITASVERAAPAASRRAEQTVARLRAAIVGGFAEGFGSAIAREMSAKKKTQARPHSEIHEAARAAVALSRASGGTLSYREAVVDLTRRAGR